MISDWYRIGIMIMLYGLFGILFVAPYEAPDEPIHLSREIFSDIGEAFGLGDIADSAASGVGAESIPFSYARNECRYLGSKPNSDYFLLKSFYVLIIVIVSSVLMKVGGLSYAQYFLWPSVAYSLMQVNEDALTQLLASLFTYVNPLFLTIAALISTATFDSSAVCSFTFLIVYMVVLKCVKKRPYVTIFFSISLIFLLEYFREVGSSKVMSLISEELFGRDVSAIISTNQEYGANYAAQVISLLASLTYLGGNASFYPTPIFYPVFWGVIFFMMLKFRQRNKAKFKIRITELYAGLVSLFVAFSMVRWLLPPVGNGRYWLIIIPLIISITGIRDDENTNILPGILVFFTFICLLTTYLTWVVKC